MSECLFCKIVRGEISSIKIYEDADFFVFLDNRPVNPGHTLVVPKLHCANFLETPEELMGKMFQLVKKIANTALAATGSSAFNIGINVGPVAGQVIMHTHVHIMPRFENDGLTHWAKKPMTEDEMERVGEMMRKKL